MNIDGQSEDTWSTSTTDSENGQSENIGNSDISESQEAENLVNKFMNGLAESDTDKIVEIIDADCKETNDDIEEIANSFEFISTSGIEYTIDYSIKSTEKASEEIIEDMCEKLYGSNDVGVTEAYICEVYYSMTMEYLDETETENNTMCLICYKKDGKWYLGR